MLRVTLLRKVMTKREARTIRRLKTVVTMLITELAKFTKRHKMIIYSVIKGDVKLVKRGPKKKLSWGFYLALAASNCSWLLLAASGCFWLHLFAHGYFWLFLGVSDCLWLLLAALGCSWLLLADGERTATFQTTITIIRQRLEHVKSVKEEALRLV